MPVPNIYETTAVTHGLGALSVPWGTHNSSFVAILEVTCAGGDTLGTPTQSGSDGTWTLCGPPCAEGTGAGSTQIAAYWCRATSGTMSNVDVPDAGDHTSARMFMLQNVVASGNPINMYSSQTVSSATATISMASPTTTVPNCLLFMFAGCGYDQATDPGGSGWTNAGIDAVPGFAGHYCTDNGTGGGYMGASGEKAVAGTTGTFAHTWASGATKQANIIFAISDTATAASGVTGTASPTIAAVTSAATARVAIAGTSSPTIGAVTSAATGRVAIAGDATPAIAPVTAAATGGATPITGTASPTIAAVTSAATGTLALRGDASPTIDAVTSAAAGRVAIDGTMSATISPVTSASAGAVALAGVATPTVGAVTSAATGALAIAGASAPTIGAVTSVATGSLTSTGVTGTASPTIAAVTSVATAALRLSATASPTVPAVTCTAAAALALRGTSSMTIAAVTLAAVGGLPAEELVIAFVSLGTLAMHAESRNVAYPTWIPEPLWCGHNVSRIDCEGANPYPASH